LNIHLSTVVAQYKKIYYFSDGEVSLIIGVGENCGESGDSGEYSPINPQLLFKRNYVCVECVSEVIPEWIINNSGRS
jgi:hypothetical protein